MSTGIETKMSSHTALEFWGGDDFGVCLQITAIDSDRFIKLTMSEAAAMCNTLSAFVKREAVRRQGILRDQLAVMKNMEKNIFDEVANLDENFFDVRNTVVTFVENFCPKTKGAL